MFDGHLSHVYAHYKRAELAKHRERTKWRMAFAQEEASRSHTEAELPKPRAGAAWWNLLRDSAPVQDQAQ